MAGRKINTWLKLGLELGPVLAFFVAFGRLKDAHVTIGGTVYGGFIIATAGFVVLMLVATLALWRLTGRLAPVQIVTLVLVLVFGGISVWLNDERFFKMKPTIIYLFFAAVLFGGLLRGKSYLAMLFAEAMPLLPEGWKILTRRMAVFFLVLAALNEVVWRNMSDQAWVNFKTFGLTAAIFLFFMTQGGLMKRYGIEDSKEG